MTRYYFHARGPNRYVADGTGFEVQSLQAAHDIAIQTIRDIADDPVQLRAHADWAMEVADEAGQTVLTIPFLEVAHDPQCSGVPESEPAVTPRSCHSDSPACAYSMSVGPPRRPNPADTRA